MIIGDDEPPVVESQEVGHPAPLEAAEPAETLVIEPEPSVAPASTPAATVAEPFASADSPARSRLLLWIGIAAGVLIVVGAGMLWLLRDKGAGDPSIEVAAMSTGVAPSPSPRTTPRRTSAIFPTVPVLEIAEPEPESVAGPDVSGPARPVVDPAPTAAEQIPAPTPSAPEPEAVASAVGAQVRAISDPPGSPGSAIASGTATATAGGPSDNQEPAEDAMAGGRGMFDEPEAKTEVETATALPSSAVPDPAIDEAPPTVSESPTIQQAPPVVPVPESETDPLIIPPAEPVVPKTRRGDLVGLTEVDEAPVAREKPTPQYPAGARSMRQEGTVNLRLLVDELGRVEQVEIDSGTRSKLLRRAAVKAAERWVYEPGIKDGVPVKVWINAVVTFKM
jgi:TonB family protein